MQTILWKKNVRGTKVVRYILHTNIQGSTGSGTP